MDERDRDATTPSREPRVLVLIPFRDRWELTARCLASLRTQQASADLRVVLIDNGSEAPATRDGLAAAGAASAPRFAIRVQRIDAPFNFSKLNNSAVAAHADFGADYLLFLNNDVELQRATDLATLLDFAERRPDLGAAGCTLLYPDGRVQHLFVAPGVKIVAAHPLKGARLKPDAAWFARPRPVPAITGAVMLIPASAFQAVGGFDESLAAVGQDVDLCLRLRALNRTCWVVPEVRLVHREGASRLGAIDKDEVRRMYEKWGKALVEDAWYSPRLSRWSETPALSAGEGAYPWDKVLP
jgi:GT2 family glycosyltransferase